MKEYFCIELKFKDKKISSETFHAHLFVTDEEMYFQIIDNEAGSQIDRNYMISKGSHGLFEDNFEITGTEVALFLDKSRIYRTQSFQSDVRNTYFTIYVSKIALVFPNKHKEFVNEGKAFLNKNGLKTVNSFYSFFTNFKDKNDFSISRMNGMKDFYDAKKISFRPELEFTNNEKRGSEQFTVKKIPTINYKFADLDFEQSKRSLEIICSFLSFCFGIRIIFEKLTYRTEEQIFIYRDTSPNNKTFVSDFSTVFYHLEKNCRIEKILKTDWYANYLTKEKQFDKAIDNYLHSREVDLTASFLLLFNIIEIFNIKQEIERFVFKESKEDNFRKAFKLISSSLEQNEDIDLLKDKWNGLINKIEIKPLKSPLEETLKLNSINPLDFGYSFNKLKKTRDKLTHGSINSISEKDLKSQIFCLRKITLRLILANLGLKNDLKNAT
jgi:tetratricopeptide (TPR) repeat protein